MSTNYYVRTAQTAPGDKGIHLGKWGINEFYFRAYPDAASRPAEVTWDVVDYGSWSRLLDLGSIETEAKRPVTTHEMVAEVQPEPGWKPPIGRNQFMDNRGRRFCPYEFF